MTDEQIMECWEDCVIDHAAGTVTFRAVSDANFKEFFTAPVGDEKAVKEAVEEARSFASSEWEQDYIEEDYP